MGITHYPNVAYFFGLHIISLFVTGFDIQARVRPFVSVAGIHHRESTGPSGKPRDIIDESRANILYRVLLGTLEFHFEEVQPAYSQYACGDYEKTHVLHENGTN